jgi:hypothetical protein
MTRYLSVGLGLSSHPNDPICDCLCLLLGRLLFYLHDLDCFSDFCRNSINDVMEHSYVGFTKSYGFVTGCVKVNIVPPGTIVRLLLSVWIKPRCSFVKDYVANPDHNNVQILHWGLLSLGLPFLLHLYSHGFLHPAVVNN